MISHSEGEVSRVVFVSPGQQVNGDCVGGQSGSWSRWSLLSNGQWSRWSLLNLLVWARPISSEHLWVRNIKNKTRMLVFQLGNDIIFT